MKHWARTRGKSASSIFARIVNRVAKNRAGIQFRGTLPALMATPQTRPTRYLRGAPREVFALADPKSKLETWPSNGTLEYFSDRSLAAEKLAWAGAGRSLLSADRFSS